VSLFDSDVEHRVVGSYVEMTQTHKNIDGVEIVTTRSYLTTQIEDELSASPPPSNVRRTIRLVFVESS